MNLRCKDGDLAIVVGDFPRCEANIGRIVQVRGPMQTPSQYPVPCWKIKPIDDREWVIAESDWSLTREVVTWRSGIIHPDCWLLPIQPPQEDAFDEEVTAESEAAEAALFL